MPCCSGEARIAVAQAAKKGVPGYVRIFHVAPPQEPVQYSQKAFQRADQIDLLWSSTGTHVLILGMNTHHLHTTRHFFDCMPYAV